MQNKNLKVLVECAILIALATVLSFIKISFPFGGSITPLSMLPIILISFRYGISSGLRSGFIYSVIQLIQGANYIGYIPTPLGVLGIITLDFILPFTLLGLAAVFYKDTYKGKKLFVSIIAGTFMVLFIRYACHVVVGSLLWYEASKAVADEGDWILTVGPWIYSIGYNITYMGPEAVTTLAASPIIIKLKDIIK